MGSKSKSKLPPLVIIDDEETKDILIDKSGDLSVNKEVYDTACDEKDREEEWGKNLKEMLNK